MKYTKQMTATVLTAVLFATAAVPAYAKSVPNDKQEVIYVMADTSGKVDDIEVINIFDGGEITDYGNYSTVKILNTTDQINQTGNQIHISSAADKVYYQGTMKGTRIPWNVSIRYFLDGKEYSASEIAGKSGALEIRFSISENRQCKGSFYEDYALQASFTLDSDKCTNITADGATLANVGSNKQISYTILPGKGIDTVIRADVTDFDMDAVAINGIKLDLNVEIDEEELKDKVNDLIDAVKQLDNGASKLYNGTEELRSGSAKFQAALKKIQTGVNSIPANDKDLTKLVAASGKIKQATSDLHTGAASLQTNLGYAQYKAIMAQNGLNIDDLITSNAEAVKTINGYKDLLNTLSKIPGYADVVEKYKPSLLQTADQMTRLLNANTAALGGMERYLNGIATELPALTNGASELNRQYKEFDTSINTLVSGLTDMTGNLSVLTDGINQLADNYDNLNSGIGSCADGAKDMTEGTGKFRSETSDMQDKMEEEIDNILDSIGGSMDNPVSFVSSRNTNIASVQFVIKTTAIEKPENKTIEPVEPEPLNFGQKLLQLFGM